MNFHIITLGCKINQYESQAITESLARRGLNCSSTPQEAEIIIINSCAVTTRAVRDLKKCCRRMARQNHTAKIIVTGCAAQVFEQELQSLDEVAQVVAQTHKTRFLQGLEQLESTSCQEQDFFISDFYRSRAIVKVQDGCDHNCTYCIVPQTRGVPRSREPQIILQEIEGLLQKGFTEIIMGGINLRLYGRDLSPQKDFWDLLAFVCRQTMAAPENFRLRMSSLEPSELNSKALDCLNRYNQICPHLHVSLQSGSPAVLKKMNRSHCNPAELIRFCNDLKSIWPVYALGADLLTGFPGETHEDYLDTFRIMNQLPLTYAHVFPFSLRPGTPAARFSGQISSTLKKERAASLQAAALCCKQKFLQKVLSQPKLQVVIENENRGMSEYYIECTVLDTFPELPPRSMIQAQPLSVQDKGLCVKAL
ncbi:tRNA (N(6)-L-threonylcarbamoyladenosine(37)-C(2))-methylthiotransferase MtaB [Desulfonatronovibrio magnus]|uniref:tRNA (N(6)-L-threonylcarbamoyladenosine(37)-C(2))- methylthiotransferase MtaB n=1 Tax=Desulfonatronovibrio magnus TaxID=698827 RepID=UPI0005EB857E|nr:tRNA (N(6)-L-threonylcarbamoyladenosine(37)-C(2))-methylthiotransferase MtaB [Desulfonatronovibrio magnus]